MNSRPVHLISRKQLGYRRTDSSPIDKITFALLSKMKVLETQSLKTTGPILDQGLYVMQVMSCSDKILALDTSQVVSAHAG